MIFFKIYFFVHHRENTLNKKGLQATILIDEPGEKAHPVFSPSKTNNKMKRMIQQE